MIRLIRELGAKKQATLRQTDTYFEVPNGRLKLREEGLHYEAALIFYSRPNSKASRLSEYEIQKINSGDTKQMKRFLQKALTTSVIVKKERILYIFQNTRIHLDRVMGLGNFLELETVISKQKMSQAENKHRAVLRALELDTCEKIPVSYSDLLLAK